MNLLKSLSVIQTILIYLYWFLVIVICIVIISLAVIYYKNHYPDPEIYNFKDFLFIASTLNLDQQKQQEFEYCLNHQDTTKVYPSIIIKDCLLKAGANFERINGYIIKQP